MEVLSVTSNWEDDLKYAGSDLSVPVVADTFWMCEKFGTSRTHEEEPPNLKTVSSALSQRHLHRRVQLLTSCVAVFC